MARIWASNKRRLWADDALVFRTGSEVPPESIQLPLDAENSPAASVTGTAQPLLGLVVLEACDRLNSPPTLEELPPAAALGKLLPHAVCFDSTDPDLERELFLAYSSLASKLPVYRLRYRQTRQAAKNLASLLQERISLLLPSEAPTGERHGGTPGVGTMTHEDRRP